MSPYTLCLRAIATAWQAYMRAGGLWTVHNFETWHEILAASDRG